ncbi:hypothetical protein AVEN_250672-1 [Araneus ventricosus]|uniref:Uncharacterized protein n=1 Tax=Araneus ventricosus TaxID=182803 RepID=A0A4Y2TEH1_ARAVE|nr:hypothetical protein AVEN_250672-1 [Araneus ventricosus]
MWPGSLKGGLLAETLSFSSENNMFHPQRSVGRGGLVVRLRPWTRGFQVSDSTEDQPCMWALHVKSCIGGQTSYRWCGAEVLREVSGVILII